MQHLPVYSLKNFSHADALHQQFQIELFDAKRHFAVQYPHRHDFFEVLFIHKGSGMHIIDDNEYEIKPPCMFFMSPGQAHKLELSNDIDGFIFLFTADFYLLRQANQNRLLEFPFFFTIQKNNPPLQLKSEEDVCFFETLFKKGVNFLAKHSNVDDFLRSLLDVMLVYAFTLYPPEHLNIQRTKGHILVKRFYQLAEDNYQKNLPVNEYASMLAITAGHLTQVIKEVTGKTSNEILQAKQILEIKRLLIHTQLGVTEIARELNFPDQSYFTKFFKRATGFTPKDFRTKSMKIT